MNSSPASQACPKPVRFRRISFFGHFAGFNWGNDSTLLAMLHNLRALLPGTEFVCICDNPDAVETNLGIKAVPITSTIFKPWNLNSKAARIARKLFIGIPSELCRCFQAFRVLRNTDLFIIPGTGLLTDVYGLHHWGPYGLFKWSLMARLCRSKLAFVCVGAGPIYGARGRWLVRSALSLADFRSYRDQSSREYIEKIGRGRRNDRVYPDLAFSLPESVVPEDGKQQGVSQVVGLGLMEYAGKYSVEQPKQETYGTYLETLVGFADWLIAHQYDIQLMTGDLSDKPVVAEFQGLAARRLGKSAEPHFVGQLPNSVEQLLHCIAGTDLVVATRFHNVLLALLLGKPVVAITFHDKCISLMHQMGLAEYCHDINRLDLAKLIEQFRRLSDNSEKLKRAIREKVEQARAALDEQYHFILNNL